MKTLIAILILAASAFGTTNTIPITNVDFWFSPYNWYSDGTGAMQSNNIRAGSSKATCVAAGCYIKMMFSTGGGSSPTVTLNLAGNTACVGCAVRYATGCNTTGYGCGTGAMAAPISQAINTGDSTISISFASYDTNALILWVDSRTNSGNDEWNTPTEGISITGITLGSTSPVYNQLLNHVNTWQYNVTLAPKNVLFLGDSMTEGAYTVTNGIINATYHWSYLVAWGLNAEYGQVGYSCQGWTVGACGGSNIPAFPSTWDHYYSGQSRLISGKLSPIPDYIVIQMGNNDSSTNVGSAVSSTLAAIRAAVNTTTPIILLGPWMGQQIGFPTITDPYIYRVSYAVPALLSSPRWSFDSVHYRYEACQMLAVSMMSAITTAMNPATVTVRSGVVFQ